MPYVYVLLEPIEGVSDDLRNVSDVIMGIYDSEKKAIAAGLDLSLEDFQEYYKDENEEKLWYRWQDGTIYVGSSSPNDGNANFVVKKVEVQ